MPTGQTIVTNVLTILGLNDPSGTPSASDSQTLANTLNDLWSSWGIDEGLIFSVQQQLFPLTANQNPYPIGPGAASPFNVPLPARIYDAVMVVAAGSGTIRKAIRIVDEHTYYAHGDLSASAQIADELYPDFNVGQSTGTAKLFLWPVPVVSATTSLELETATPFGTWLLGTNYSLPEGYQDGIQYALAYRALPIFGVAVAQEVALVVRDLGMKAEKRLRQMNAINRRLTPEQAGIEPEAAPAAAGR
jgi:hypothetical protein